MAEKLLLIPWFVGLLYSSIPLFWFAIHPFARRWQKVERSPYRVLLPLWAATMAVLVLATWPWHTLQIYSGWWTPLPALPFFWLGARTYIRIRAEFGMKRLTGEAELRPSENEQAVIATGLHGIMRHPIYIAHLCMLTGWTLLGGLTIDFALLALCLFCTFPLMIWLEERELQARFGESYRTYRKTVPLFPRTLSMNFAKIRGQGNTQSR